MQKCLIIGGAQINNWDRVKQYIDYKAYTIVCDSGIGNCKEAGILPDLIIGDFDSSEKPKTKVETIVLPREKDDTDTVYAIKEAMARGYDEILLIGAVGQRIDHSLVNIYSLYLMEQNNVKGTIVDDYSQMEIVSNETAVVDDSFAFFSLVAIEGQANNVTIKNAKFELTDGTITPEYQYATSNEVIPGKKAEITVGDGKLLLIKVFRGSE